MFMISCLIKIGNFFAHPKITKRFLYDIVTTQTLSTLPTRTSSSPNNADHYSISPEDHAKYYQLFQSYDDDNNGY